MSTGARVSDSSTGAGRRPPNRRELILDAAIELFHQRGYPLTSVDDIGKAVDVSGPAIYRHFASKEEILLDAIQLAADEVNVVAQRARDTTDDPHELLEAFIRAYAGVALERSALIVVWNSEARHVSSTRRAPMVRRLRSWFTEWIEVLRSARPELDEHAARVLVTGAIGLITSVSTSADRSLHDAQLADSITTMALATLGARVP